MTPEEMAAKIEECETRIVALESGMQAMINAFNAGPDADEPTDAEPEAE